MLALSYLKCNFKFSFIFNFIGFNKSELRHEQVAALAFGWLPHERTYVHTYIFRLFDTSFIIVLMVT